MRSHGIWRERFRGFGMAATASLLLVACGKSNSTGPCAMVGCGDIPLCSVGCTATCGCCSCVNGQVQARGAGRVVCTNGCWSPLDGGADAAVDGDGDGSAGATDGAPGGSGGGSAGASVAASGGAGGGAPGGGQGGALAGHGGTTMATGGRSGTGGLSGPGGADGGIDAPLDAGSGGTGDASNDVAPGDSQPTASGAVDIIFLVDDSSSMTPLQAKLAQAFSGFMNTLESLPGGLPSIHIAVVSSSLGAGVFSTVSGCTPGTDGNRRGAFLHPPACTALPSSEHFLSADGVTKNFTGDISDVFGCMAMIGASGCGFEHQFEAARQALVKAQNSADPDNAGFLRPDADLAVIMLTNEDDCSVPADSVLLDPIQQTLADPVGGLQSYRCNEFGHLCSGVAPPHLPPATPVALTDCVPAEAQGRLTTVSDFVAFLRALKPTTSKTFVAAMAGPVTPYIVESKSFFLGNGGMESQPSIQHSCSNATGTYADPAVRIKAWVDAFGANGVFESLCPDDLGPPMMRIAQSLARVIGR